MKRNYKNYNLETFVADDEFVDWVLNPKEETEVFWNQWMIEHPEKVETMLAAKAFIQNIYAVEHQFAPTDSGEELWKKIEANTLDQKTKPSSTQIRSFHWFKYAAAIALLAFISFGVYRSYEDRQAIAQSEKSIWILEENTSGISQKIYLVDGSTVILEPYSTLKYPTVFNGTQRNVFLQGEAFFDVARDTTQPFLIYANETITKVLGTSFSIKAFEGNDNVEVLVKTGKVAIYATVASKSKKQSRKRMIVKADEEISLPLPNRKLEITPNQKVVFNKKKKELVKTIAPEPILIEQSVNQIKKFEFEEEPVKTVFEALEMAYGLEIKFDKEQLKDCTITTSLTDMPMLDKVNVICHALSLSFEEKDGVIMIEGKGC